MDRIPRKEWGLYFCTVYIFPIHIVVFILSLCINILEGENENSKCLDTLICKDNDYDKENSGNLKCFSYQHITPSHSINLAFWANGHNRESVSL